MADMGFEFPDSMSNFLFVTHKKYDMTQLYEYLREKDIYVRHWNNPLIKDYLRITIGTDEEMNKLYDAIKVFMKEN